MRSIFLVMTALGLSACTYSLGPPMEQVPQPQPQQSTPMPQGPLSAISQFEAEASPYEGVETSNLCKAYRDDAIDPGVRMSIEVELVERGEKFCDGANIGMSSIIKMGRQRFSRVEAGTEGTTNCGRYATGAAAQKAFLKAGGPRHDPEFLDRDGDGLACGWGDDLKLVATAQPEGNSEAVQAAPETQSKAVAPVEGGSQAQ